MHVSSGLENLVDASSGLDNCLNSADLLYLTLYLGLHSHEFYDQQTIPGIDGFADSIPVRGLQRMVS